MVKSYTPLGDIMLISSAVELDRGASITLVMPLLIFLIVPFLPRWKWFRIFKGILGTHHMSDYSSLLQIAYVRVQ